MSVKGGDLGPEPEELSGRIKEARKQRGMSQARLAELVRADPEVVEVVAQDYVSRWETGTSGTSPAIQRAIARALDVSAGWLTHGTGPGITPPPWRQAAQGEGTADLEPALPPMRKRHHPAKGRRRQA
jgi:Predicted transcriptional regulators